MKAWYIVFSDSEQKCEFVSVSAAAKLLILLWPNGARVKIRIHDFKREYKEALDGNLVVAYAVSSKNRNSGKPIKIVFK